MLEKLVSYETALLAQQCKFDINTGSKCWIRTLDNEIIHNSLRENKPEHDRCTVILFQPSISQLQEWLMKNHNLVVIPRHCEGNEYSDMKFVCIISGQTKSNKRLFTKTFNNYNQALEEGLVVALNEIIKKSSKKFFLLK